VQVTADFHDTVLDREAGPEEIDAVDFESGEFPKAKTSVGRQEDEGSVSLSDGVGEPCNLAGA
jgi:hypothetical protein